MSGTTEPEPSNVARQHRRRGLMPPEFIDIVVPPLKVGAWCGGAGAFTGIGAAILSDASLAMSGIMTGTQWAVLGTTYWFSRQMAIRAMGGEEKMTPSKRVQASAIASVPTGAMLGVSVGRTKRMGSSLIFCGVAAVGGQLVANHFTSRQEKAQDEDDSWLGSKWSPLKKLTDEEYISMMDEKILRVDADIALIDDKIAQLREQANGEKRAQDGKLGK